MMQERHDVFVGNLTFNVTDDRLREVFEFVGKCNTTNYSVFMVKLISKCLGHVKSVRVVTDKETGKSKGFAFVEFYDANSALAAIKHLNGYELNSRKIVVGFPSHSNLREVAKQMGESFQGMGAASSLDEEQMLARHRAEQSVVQSVALHEAWDILDSLKRLLADDRRGNKLRAFVEEHPEVVNAVYELEKRLGIVLPTHILMGQPKLPSLTSGATASSSGAQGTMVGLTSTSQSMGIPAMYDNNAMWAGAAQLQQQQLQQSLFLPTAEQMSVPAEFANSLNADFYQNTPGSLMGQQSEQQSNRRSRFK